MPLTGDLPEPRSQARSASLDPGCRSSAHPGHGARAKPLYPTERDCLRDSAPLPHNACGLGAGIVPVLGE